MMMSKVVLLLHQGCRKYVTHCLSLKLFSDPESVYFEVIYAFVRALLLVDRFSINLCQDLYKPNAVSNLQCFQALNLIAVRHTNTIYKVIYKINSYICICM